MILRNGGSSMSDPSFSNHLTAISQHPARLCRSWGYLLALPTTLQAISSSKSNMQMCIECIECSVKTQKTAKNAYGHFYLPFLSIRKSHSMKDGEAW